MTEILVVLVLAAIAIFIFNKTLEGMTNSLDGKQKEDIGQRADDQKDAAPVEVQAVQPVEQMQETTITEITLPPVSVPTTAAEIIVEEKTKKTRKYNKKPAGKQPQKKTPKKSKSA